MALVKLPFKPGINREIPEYANEGGYDFSNLIRFRMGYAEKLGGWASTNYVAYTTGVTNTLSTYTFNGVTRSITNWVTLNNENLIGFGTTQEFYVQNGLGTPYHDISPTDYSATGTTTLRGASFRTVAIGSPLIEMVNSGFLGNINNAGTLYTAGFYSNVNLTGGSGTGAKANITVTSGSVTAVTIIDSGVGYKVGDVLSATAASIGGTGSGFQFTIIGGTAGDLVYSSIISPPLNSGLDVGSAVYFFSNNLSGFLAMETSGYILLEDGSKIIIGTQPSLTINGVTVQAQYTQNNINATPYFVTSVTKKTITQCSGSATATTVTLIGTATGGAIPIVGTNILVSGLNIAAYNGNYKVLSCTYNPATTLTTITYANTTGVASVADGTITWINSFQFIGSGNATAVGYEQSNTTLLGFSIDASYLPNAGDSTTKYTTIGSYPINKRLWSQSQFNDDLIMSIQGNPIYYWTKDTINWLPAVKLSEYANAQIYQQAAVTNNTISGTSFYVDFNDYVYPGQTITINSGSGSIPTTPTKVVDITGLLVTVDNPVTVYGGGGVNTGTLSGGTSYKPTSGTATYTGVNLTGGSGSGAVATLTVTNGAVSAVTVTSVGLNYAAGDILGASQAAGQSWLGGMTLGNQGQGYPNNTTYTNVPMIYYTGAGAAPVGTGTGAIATIVTDNSGHINLVNINFYSSGNSPGTGYKVGETLTSLLGGASYGTQFYITLSAAGTGFSYTLTSVYSQTNLNLSYSGQYVPTQTNKIFISSVYQFAIALGANPYNPFNPSTTFNPMLVRWSDQTNPSEWIPKASNQSGEQTLGNGSTLVTAVANLQIVLVFTDVAVYQMQYVGAPFVFNFTLLQDNISIISQNAAVTANNITWWMGNDKFYTYNGTVQVLPCPVRRYVFTNINKEYAWKTVVGYNEGFSEIWWFYPSSTSQINDSYVKYNFTDQVWDYGSLNRTAWNGNTTYDYPTAAYSVQNTYLTASYSTGATMSVADTSSFHDSGILLIDDTQIIYTGKTSTSFTGCTRVSGTSTFPIYTTVKLLTPNQLMFHEYGLDDNTIPNVTLPVQSFIQSSDIGMAEGNSLCTVNRIIPDLTFTNSNPTTCPNPSITMTVYPRLNPGSDYRTDVDTPTVTSTYLPINEAAPYPPEQYTGQPSQTVALLTAGQGQVYTRVRGRTISLRVDTGNAGSTITISGYPIPVTANSIGNMWQLGLMRFDVRMDGKR